MPESLELAARDGTRLAATLYRPAGAARHAALLHAATGTPRRFYGKFAAYLAERGIAVLTFDYRGIGESRRGPLRGLGARMRDWAQLDAGAALEFLAREFGGSKLLAVGHSFGGNGLGLVPGVERYAGALFVGVQSGYWRHWRGTARAGMWFLVHVLLPSFAALLGYVPMKAFGQGEDLPGGVAAEWASWCRNPRYAAGAVGAEGYARLTAPIRSYWVSDDLYAPRAAAEALFDLYPHAASTELVPIDASAHGGIGHFGFFRERFRGTLWRDAADWLLAA
ncbi:MAG TPA: alpha/beta fold hydrolase [Burkholderiales bacterium]|nr:alpha/beta fold hydrolase [Burkholderiales bacterium]